MESLWHVVINDYCHANAYIYYSMENWPQNAQVERFKDTLRLIPARDIFYVNICM